MLGNILAVGLMSMGMGLSGVKDEPQMYIENEATYTITYENANDWKERAQSIYTWANESNYTTLANALVLDAGSVLIDSENTSYTLSKLFVSENVIWLRDSNTNAHKYDLTTETWKKDNTAEQINSVTIVNQTYYEGNKYVPPQMGIDIVGTIASGLGIIGALATTFLTGFGNLFYSSGALTPFAIFALVMLGIAVSFAVVKLVLNLIRSNTGA